MVLYIIGLGLGDEKDITVRGLEAIRKSSQVFLECYTSILSVDKEKLEAFYQKPITIADRTFVEDNADQIYLPAAQPDTHISLLIVGDPVCATTHTDLLLRAYEQSIPVELIHNASVMGAAGCCGLQLYNFGQTVSIPLYEGTWRPRSFVGKLGYNRGGGMHTLCLLDIKVKEPDFGEMAKGRTVFLPPRYMTVNVACEQLIEAVDDKEESGDPYNPTETLCVGMARLGQEDQCIIAGTMEELKGQDFGGPLHCMVVCGQVHDLELEFLKRFIVEGSTYKTNDFISKIDTVDNALKCSEGEAEESDDKDNEKE